MQIKFLTTLLLVGVCFSQVTFAHPHETAAQRNLIDDLIAQAKQAIEKVQSFIKEKIDEASKAFDKFKDQIVQLGLDAVENASGKLSEIIANVQKQIDEIKHKAEEAGEDISACLTDVGDRLEDLFGKFFDDEIGCIMKEVDDARNIINEAVQIVDEARKSVEDLPEKLKACGTGLSSITCINKVILDVAKLQVDLPRKIAEKVTEVSTFIAGLKVRLETCAVSQVANAGLAAAGVLADVAKCVADQIGKPAEKRIF